MDMVTGGICSECDGLALLAVAQGASLICEDCGGALTFACPDPSCDGICEVGLSGLEFADPAALHASSDRVLVFLQVFPDGRVVRDFPEPE